MSEKFVSSFREEGVMMKNDEEERLIRKNRLGP
jgi:hypothetical protein